MAQLRPTTRTFTLLLISSISRLHRQQQQQQRQSSPYLYQCSIVAYLLASYSNNSNKTKRDVVHRDFTHSPTLMATGGVINPFTSDFCSDPSVQMVSRRSWDDVGRVPSRCDTACCVIPIIISLTAVVVARWDYGIVCGRVWKWW